MAASLLQAAALQASTKLSETAHVTSRLLDEIVQLRETDYRGLVAAAAPTA
jgi:hypothetical protein